jgi:5-methylcytosine-specific restriction endonuclease McrA
MPRNTEAYKAYQKKYQKDYYAQNAEAVKARMRQSNKLKREERKLFLLEYLLVNPCVDCGETDLVVLEFDHTRGTKSANITALLTASMTKLLEELNKCDVVCANCHTRRTAKRAGWPRFLS